MQPNSVLLYDGLCGLCDGTVQFILAHDKKWVLRFAPLQGEFANEFFARRPDLRTVDSIILVHPATAASPARAATQTDAVVQLAHYLGGPWVALGWLLRVVPRPIRDAGYNFIARVRYRVFGTRAVCRIPDASERARFLA